MRYPEILFAIVRIGCSSHLTAMLTRSDLSARSGRAVWTGWSSLEEDRHAEPFLNSLSTITSSEITNRSGTELSDRRWSSSRVLGPCALESVWAECSDTTTEKRRESARS